MLNVTYPPLRKVVQYNVEYNALSLLQYVAITLGALLALALIFCVCCFCIKLSDLKMKSYIIDLARRRGVKLDLEEIDRKRHSLSPLANQNCAIFVPEVGIIL
ncbi:hypothetical protein O0L34_g9254 [Tuta absoluta]|nr:hypothetical protein O0L34_g9254 [Tuta absoluta]